MFQLMVLERLGMASGLLGGGLHVVILPRLRSYREFVGY